MLADVIIFVFNLYSPKIVSKCDGIVTNCDSLVYYPMRWTVVTNCDSFFITKCDTVYYKLRQVLQSAMDLLQIATGITKCDDYYKLRQYNPLQCYDSWKRRRQAEFQSMLPCFFCLQLKESRPSHKSRKSSEPC